MKNSNRYKNIFSPKENLSIEDINRYDSSKGKTRNKIEQKEMASDFEKDAMEGWESVGFDTSILENHKNPFTPKSKNGLYIIIGVIVVGIITSFFFIPKNAEPKNKTVAEINKGEQQEIIIESSDVYLPENIEQLTVQPIENQISIDKIKNDFTEIEEINANLPVLKPHQIEEKHSTDIILNKQKGKELYLNELKLIDYSTYRTESFIETQQFVLTGTPADRENEHTENYQTEWKTIKQPYSLYIENTLYYFNNGEYKKALARFDIILKKYENDINANFYSGLCLYNFGEYDEAILRFKKCVNGDFNNFDEEAKWMIANSHENKGDLIRARKLYQEIIAKNSCYNEQANEKLKQLD